MQDLIQTLTADLRLSLLVLGAVVITALILWELGQRWRARKADAAHVTGPDDVDDVLVRDTVRPSSAGTAHTDDAPLISSSRVAASTPQTSGAQASTPEASTPEASTPEASTPTTSLERSDPVELPSMSARDDFDDRWASLVSEKRAESTVPTRESVTPVAGVPAATTKTRIEDFSAEDLPDEGIIGPAREITSSVPPSVTATNSAALATDEHASSKTIAVAQEAPTSAVEPVVVRIEWPPEDQRRVVGLRIVGKGGERFTGASLRQALLGEGFVFGEMDIFHRPVADGRVLMSAASLTQPGTFNLDSMDASLFRGLNLFAVLPGPLPGRDAVDKLLLVGHTLAQRVRGELQDGRGQALTEARLAEMRREAGSASG